MSVDTGGTFTDVVVLTAEGEIAVAKTPSTPENQARGIVAGLRLAAEGLGLDLPALLGGTAQLLHGTTVATNAIVQGRTARTGCITTRGFRDVLLFREGGKPDPHDFRLEWPDSYVPRYLIQEVTERVESTGEIVVPLDEDDVRRAIAELRRRGVEAVAVCLIWSIENPAHERRVAEILAAEWPEAQVTVSHIVNPIVREYRRFSSAAIDASLKPVMAAYLDSLESDLAAHGFTGDVGIFSSGGGVISIGECKRKPIMSIGSGPAVAPVAALFLAEQEHLEGDLLVVDAGGTTFDVAAIRSGHIVVTHDVWIGPEYLGHLTGMSSVDVRSVGAGGGSIASVDSAGLLRVGPESVGAHPGPSCYGRGGTEATVTDAAVVLGYIDPGQFLGGRMPLDAAKAAHAIEERVARTLGLSVREAAAGILELQTANMVAAIEDITINQGFDPRESSLVAGGGAAGLNITSIAAALGIRRVLVPGIAGALSAFGGLVSDVSAEFPASYFAGSEAVDLDRVDALLRGLSEEGRSFLGRMRIPDEAARLEYVVEARYPHQVWELRVPFAGPPFTPERLAATVASFHRIHRRVFAVDDPSSSVELVNWIVRAIGTRGPIRIDQPSRRVDSGWETRRNAYFRRLGDVEVPVVHGGGLQAGAQLAGPAILAEELTTIVLHPESRLTVTRHGNFLLEVA